MIAIILASCHMGLDAEPRKSGDHWCGEFNHYDSRLVWLSDSFAPKAREFIDALREAGAKVTINSTRRAPQKQFLMHWSYQIGQNKYFLQAIRPCTPGINGEEGTWYPPSVPAYSGSGSGVDIIWRWISAERILMQSLKGCSGGCSAHWNNCMESIKAANDMVRGYGLVHQPGMGSRHTTGQAIDMTITWSGELEILKKDGSAVKISTMPNSGQNSALHAVGETYGVFKLVSDPPHWSEDGR